MNFLRIATKSALAAGNLCVSFSQRLKRLSLLSSNVWLEYYLMERQTCYLKRKEFKKGKKWGPV